MNPLEQLYQQVILDHAKEKHGRAADGVLRHATAGGLLGESRQYNPLCGDEVTARVERVLTGDEVGASDVVQDLSWVGDGCSISQAATSVLHDLVVGQTVEQAGTVVAAFRTMVRSRGTVEPDEEVLGDASAFAGVGRHANRVKCAMLGWTAFEAALHETELAQYRADQHATADEYREGAR